MRRITLPGLSAGLALAALLVCSPLFAYNVKLKDGSIIFARTKYLVKGKKAIITLQNGTVTSYDLDQVDIPGTEQYNKENPGNVLVIDSSGDRPANVSIVTPNPTSSLQDVIRRKKVTVETKAERNSPEANAALAAQQVDATIDQAFRKVLDGAGITQYRLANQRGKLRFLATTNTEEAVFNTVSAAARALADLGSRGRDVSVEIVLTTSGGESGGSFQMTADQARLIVNGNVTVADYFLKNVIL
ncbi:MAG: hypothetical protein M3R62_07395 [Acidobacteriota bacterium]|nr:hypothetical protein [Acidobacteriota bacterium]